MSQSDENDILSPPAAESEWRALLKPQYLASTVMLCMGVALYAFNGFLVSTVLPSAVADIGGAQLMSWSLTLYIAASIVAGAGGASLKANFGARRALISGSLLFLIGTFFAATAQDMGFVLVGRVLQGAGEGLVAAICYSLIPEMFPAAMVTKVFGAEAMVWAVAAFVGPVLSGALTDMFSWRMAFLINVPVAGLFILMAVLLVPKGNKPDDRARFPGLRLILLSAGLTALLVADLGGNLVMTVLIIALAGAMIALAIRTDRKASAPILPQGAFSLHSTLGLGLWVVLLMPVSQATGSVYLVFAMQNLFGLTTTMAGAIGALMAIGWSLTAIAIANLDSRHGVAGPDARHRGTGVDRHCLRSKLGASQPDADGGSGDCRSRQDRSPAADPAIGRLWPWRRDCGTERKPGRAAWRIRPILDPVRHGDHIRRRAALGDSRLHRRQAGNLAAGARDDHIAAGLPRRRPQPPVTA